MLHRKLCSIKSKREIHLFGMAVWVWDRAHIELTSGVHLNGVEGRCVSGGAGSAAACSAVVCVVEQAVQCVCVRVCVVEQAVQ